MSTITTTATDARVWVGCLACYNAGRLVGAWYPATDADHITPHRVHVDGGLYGERHEITPLGHDELWVFDHEHLPIEGECSPAEATLWGLLLTEVDEWQRDAFLAWVREGNYSHDGSGQPSLSDFEDAYAGEWASFREYAEDLADDIGLLSDVPDEIATYFDWDAWTRDLAYDYTTATAVGGGVYVFRNC